MVQILSKGFVEIHSEQILYYVCMPINSSRYIHLWAFILKEIRKQHVFNMNGTLIMSVNKYKWIICEKNVQNIPYDFNY